MLDVTELYRLVGSRPPGPDLEDETWRGGVDGYLRAILARPELLGGAHRLLRRAAERGALEGGPPGGLAEAFEALSRAPQAVPRALAIRCAGPEAWSDRARRWAAGLEGWTRTPEGALFAYRWVNLEGGGAAPGDPVAGRDCPLRETPLRLIPEESRRRFVADLAGGAPVEVPGPLCAECAPIERDLLGRYRGDWGRMAAHVEVYRLLASEAEGRCVGRVRLEDVLPLVGPGAPEPLGEAAAPRPGGAAGVAGIVAANRGLLILERGEGDLAAEEFWRVVEALLDPGRLANGSSGCRVPCLEPGAPLDYVLLAPVFAGEGFGEPPPRIADRVARWDRDGD